MTRNGITCEEWTCRWCGGREKHDRRVCRMTVMQRDPEFWARRHEASAASKPLHGRLEEIHWLRIVERRSIGFIAAKFGVTRQAINLIVSPRAKETQRRARAAARRRSAA